MDICLTKYVCTDLCFQMKQSCAVMIAGVDRSLQARASSSLLKYSTDISLSELCECDPTWAGVSGKAPGEYQFNLETDQLKCWVGFDSVASAGQITFQRSHKESWRRHQKVYMKCTLPTKESQHHLNLYHVPDSSVLLHYRIEMLVLYFQIMLVPGMSFCLNYKRCYSVAHY